MEQDFTNNAELEDSSGIHPIKDEFMELDKNFGVLVKKEPGSTDLEDEMEQIVRESGGSMEMEEIFDKEIFMKVEINNDGEIRMETVEAFDDEALEQVESSGVPRVQVKVEEEEIAIHSSPVFHPALSDAFTRNSDAEAVESSKGCLGDMQAVHVMNSTSNESCPQQTFKEEGLSEGEFKKEGTLELALGEQFMESQVLCKQEPESSDPGEMQASSGMNYASDRSCPQSTFAVEGLTNDQSVSVGTVELAVGEQFMESQVLYKQEPESRDPSEMQASKGMNYTSDRSCPLPTFAVEGLTNDQSGSVGIIGLAVEEQLMGGPLVWKAEPGVESQTWVSGEESVPIVKVKRVDEEGEQEEEARDSAVHPVLLVVHSAARQKRGASHCGEGSSEGRKRKRVGTRARQKQGGSNLAERSSVDRGRRGSKYMRTTARQKRSSHVVGGNSVEGEGQSSKCVPTTVRQKRSSQFVDGSSVEGEGTSSKCVRTTARQKRGSSNFVGESFIGGQGRGGKRGRTWTSSRAAYAESPLQQAHSKTEVRSAPKTSGSSSSSRSGSSSSETADEMASVACQANFDYDDDDDEAEKLYCPHCLFECEDEDDLQQHIEMVHVSRKEHHTKLKISGQTGMQYIVVEPCVTKQAYKTSLKEGTTVEPPSRKLAVKNIRKKCGVVKPRVQKHVTTDSGEHSSDYAKNYACPTCDFKSTWKGSLTRHMDTAHQNGKYSCPLCNNQYSSESDMKVHIAVAHEHLKNGCPHCDYRSKLKSSLHRHIQMVHGGVTKCESPQKQRKGGQQSLKKDESPQSKSKHQRRHQVKTPAESTPQDVEKTQCPCEEKGSVKRCVKSVKKLQCPRCAFKCSQMPVMQAHIQRKHSHCMRLQCPQCDYCCEMESVMMRHQAMAHGGSTKFLCHHCEFQSEQESELLTHMKSQHSGQKNHKCPHCDYSAVCSSNLEVHVQNVHDGIKTYQCPHCEITCSQKGSLKRHLDTVHSDQKKYRCPHCKLLFAQKGSLKRHLDTVHSDQKKYKCPHCDYKSGLHWNVKTHIENVHERSQKHRCPHCKFWSWYKRTLREHIQNLHHSQKKYQCSQCDFGSVHKSYLQAHVESVHEGIKRHRCPHCPYQSAHKWNLKVHMDRMHV